MFVNFQGPGEGTGPLSWGQLENWSAIVKQGTWLPLGGIRPLPAGTTLEDVAAEVRYAMSRYQPMRTLVRTGDDGHPVQVVHAAGALEVPVHDTGGEAPQAAAQRIHDELRDAPLDFAAQWPVRYAVIRHRGTLTHLVVLLSHLVTDAAGATTMMAEVAAREPAPVAGLQPLAQAQWQQSPAGRRQHEHARRHWEAILRTVDPVRFPAPARVAAPRYRHAEFSSPALHTAVRGISARSGVDTPTVLLALYAAALHETLGVDPVVIRPITSNRFRPGLAGVVCTLAQGGLFSLEVGGAPFDELLPRAGRAALSAYKYAYFHQPGMAELVERVGRERGAPIELGCYFNDRRSTATTAEPTVEGESVWRWVTAQDAPTFEPLFVHVDDVPGTVQLSIYLDTAYVAPADAEAVARGMQRIASRQLQPAAALP